MSQDEMLKNLKRRVVELLQGDGMAVGACDVAPGYTKHGAICKVTVEVLVPTEGAEPYVDSAVEDMKGMSYMAVTLFVMEELLSRHLQPGSLHARDMAAEIRSRRMSLPSHRAKVAEELEFPADPPTNTPRVEDPPTNSNP